MSPEDRHKIVITGEATRILDEMGIDTTGDPRPAYEILERFDHGIAQQLSLRAETLIALNNKV